MKKLISVFLFVVFFAGNLYCEEKTAENKSEIKKTEETKKEKAEKISTAEKVFFCSKEYTGPAFIGWCEDGNYFGWVHMGSIGVAFTGDFHGISQISGFLSVTERFYGIAQIGGLASVSMKDFYGFAQIGGLLSGGDNFYGIIQLSGLISVSFQNFRGAIQIGSVLSISNSFKGAFQVGLLSMSGFAFTTPFLSIENQEKFVKENNKEFHGFYGAFQIGVLVSGASTFKGISQIGAYNVSFQHYGGQIGIVNRSKVVRGVQIGIVNYTEKLYGLQLGLVNIAQNGFLPYTTILNIGW